MPAKRPSAQGSLHHQRQQDRSEYDAVPGEDREAVRLYVAQQPFHRDERHHRRDHETDDERGPALAAAAAAHLEELVAGGGEHGRDPDEERKLGRRGTQRETCEHGREDGAPGAGGAGKDRRQDLAQSYPERDVPGHRGAGGFARDVALDDENQDPADKGRQRHGYHGLRQLPSQAGGEISPRRRGQEGHGELRQVVAVRRLVAARQEIQQAAPVNEHQREDRARLDRHIEQLRAFTQPLLGDEQMPGARDGQKFGDALDDAENGGAGGGGHLNVLTYAFGLRAAHSEAEDCRELRAIRARSARAGAKARPDIAPHQRNHRI